MAISSTIHPDARDELCRVYHELTTEEREALQAPVERIDNEFGKRLVYNHNFAYHYSTLYTYDLETGERLRISSFHWGDAYYEKDMLELLYERLPYRRP